MLTEHNLFCFLQGLKFGIVSTYDRSFFVERTGDSTYRISDGIHHAFVNPSMLQGWYCKFRALGLLVVMLAWMFTIFT